MPRSVRVATCAALALWAFGVPSLAQAKGGRKDFDDEEGVWRDPRRQTLPRTHRFRLAAESGWIRLTALTDTNTGEVKRYHFAPLMLNMGYQAQFLRYATVRLSAGVGPNVANSNTAMSLVVNPKALAGFQGRYLGVLVGYGFMLPIPASINARGQDGLEQPVIWNNHQVGGELSFTSRVDRVALSFAAGFAMSFSRLSHTQDFSDTLRYYPMLTLGAGVYFDGSIRRARKKKREASGLAVLPR